MYLGVEFEWDAGKAGTNLRKHNLKTTQIYTHVAIRQLQEIHRATHPAKPEREKQEIDV